MYNGIGLVTPRGSGTNGYVQRNMSFVQKSREKVSYKTEEDIKKLDALANRKPNQGILAHERKRTIELKCLEMQELMEDQGYPDDEIEAKVAMFRQMLVDKEGAGEKEIPKDEFGRPIVKESHQIAEANQEKNSKMREALGISQYFVEGSSLDPERRAKEAAAAAAEEAKKKYTLIPDSSSSSSPERSQDKEKDKKRKKKKSHSNREKEEESPKKKKSVKKHKKDRSVSPDVQKKKKVKKPIKEKSKHKSKSDATRKKQSARSSSSSSSSSSDSADNESSSRATSRDSQSETSVERQKEGPKQHQKPQKANRKRSTSSERIRYSKDARSRKDIYEAKKDRHKRRSVQATSSSSSGDSSPKQYFRLEPVLLKSKSKRKGAHQIIEIPSASAFELKKYERKKRAHESASSEEEAARPEGKRRKRSESPLMLKSSKHRSERDEVKAPIKMDDCYKSSRRSEKEYHSSMPEKHRRDRSRSTGSQRKYHHKVQTISDDESDGHRRKGKERPTEIVEERHHEKGSKSKKKHSRKELESPVRHNGYHKHPAKPRTQESEDSDRSERSISTHKRKKNIPKSPSHSPVGYKNKKHVIKSPSYDPPNHQKKKSAPKHHKPHQSVSKSPPLKRHDSDTSRSPSPTVGTSKKNGRDLKTTNQTSRSNWTPPRRREENQSRSRSPPRRRDENQSPSRSPSQRRSGKTKSKQRLKRAERSPNGSIASDASVDRYADRRTRPNEWKSKGEVKEVSCRSRSNSPMHFKSSKSKKKRDPSEELSEMRILSPKNKKGMTIIVESCRISPSKETAHLGNRNRNSLSVSPVRVESKRHKRDKDAEKTPNKSSPVWSKEKEASPKLEKSKRAVAKVCQSSSNEIRELKVKRSSPDETTAVMPVLSKDTTAEDAFTARKNNWNLITNSNNQSPNVPQSPRPRGPSAPKNEESVTPVTKEDTKTSTQKEGRRPEQSKDKRKTSTYSPSRSRSASENKEAAKGSKQRTPSRSRSRSTSIAHSGSERSSRSRSYSRRGTKSYSKSRSQSYSKSRSHSHSRSKTRSKSRSKSHSRSRSKSYSRSISIDSRSRSRSYSSRSRSRSNARSPSIPRRRGSPSFLDKRRITSARKRPVPYRRPSPSTPSSASSWSRSSSPLPHHLLSSRSRSWSPVLRQKHEVAIHTTALR